MNDWISVDDELPPCDGTYWISNFAFNMDDPVIVQNVEHAPCLAYYDGYGFKYGIAYRTPKYWGYYTELQKQYGKVAK